MAATVRVGLVIGPNDAPGIKRAGPTAMLLGVVIAAVLTVAGIAAHFDIAELFLGGSGPDADATIGLAARLLLIGPSFFITDAMHGIAAGGLRGLKDTWVPLLLAGLSYWLIGFALSYVFGLKIGLDVTGIWIGLSIGTTIYAARRVARFQLAGRLALRSRYITA